MSLQSDIVVTLGTIGALAIIRFRTAIKDPVDMVYLLWSVHNGIMAGCQLYEVAILTSAVVTLMLLILTNCKGLFNNKEYTLVVNVEDEENLITILKETDNVKYRIVSRSYSENGINIVVYIKTKDAKKLSGLLKNRKDIIRKFSLLSQGEESIL